MRRTKKKNIESHRVEPSVEAFAELHLGVSSITFAAVQHTLFHTDLMQMQHREQWTCWIEPLIFFGAFFPMHWHQDTCVLSSIQRLVTKLCYL
jgi:hypothetical protein